MHCSHTICGSKFADKPCKCYTSLDQNDLKGLTPAQRTKRINSQQFCGYLGDDGFIYGCDPSCCSGGCPGECTGVSPRPPSGTAPPDTPRIDRSTKGSAQKKVLSMFNIALIVLVLLSLATLITTL